MDVRPLGWMYTPEFVDLARACGFPVDEATLAHLGEEDILPSATNHGAAVYSVVHLGILWLYKSLVITWRHPWEKEAGPAPAAEGLDRLKGRLQPLRLWLNGGPFEASWWRVLERELAENNVLGQAKSLGLMLDASILQSVHGEARLFLEIDRFFVALWDTVASQSELGSSFPSVQNLLNLAPPRGVPPSARSLATMTPVGPGPLVVPSDPDSLDSGTDVITSDRPNVGMPRRPRSIDLPEKPASPRLESSASRPRLELETLDGPKLELEPEPLPDGPDELPRFGFERRVRRSTMPTAPELAPRVPEDRPLTPAEAAREHARRAAAETSALISLATGGDAGRRSERQDSFREHEQTLIDSEKWADLADHYASSLDLFESDQAVGNLMRQVGTLHYEKLNQPEEAARFFMRALERLPTDEFCLVQIDRLLRSQARFEELAAIWQRAATKAFGGLASKAWSRVAEILIAHLGNLREAMRALRFAIEADPGNKRAHRALSRLASISPEERSAQIRLSGDAREWHTLAEMAKRWAQRQDGDREASDWYVRAAELYLSHESGVDDAFRCLEQAIERTPDRGSAVARLEALARNRDRWETFTEVVERLIEREKKEGRTVLNDRFAELFRERIKNPQTTEPEPFVESLSGLFKLPMVTELARRKS